MARLDEFLTEAKRQGGDLRWAVELREASWLHEETFAVLRHHGVRLVPEVRIVGRRA